jgi:hypothetical protein
MKGMILLPFFGYAFKIRSDAGEITSYIKYGMAVPPISAGQCENTVLHILIIVNERSS